MTRLDYTPPTFVDVPNPANPPAGAVALDAAHVNAMAQAIASSGPLSRQATRHSLAAGKVRGGNLAPRPTVSWVTHWTEWDWANWIQPQVDRAAALGMNTVRVIGAPEVVTTGVMSQATYNARWAQLAAYCQSLNIRLYACLCERNAFEAGHTAPFNFQDAAATAAITSSAATLAAYSNTIAFDVFQEGSGATDGLVVGDVVALYAAIRAAAPGVPLTTSNSSGGFGSAAGFWTDTTSLPYQAWTTAGGADFVDVHVYLDTLTPGDLDNFLTKVGKPILIGEYGDSQDQTTTAQTARFQKTAALHNRRGVLGSLVWALADQSTVNTNQWGVWDNTGFVAGSSPLSTTSGKRTAMTSVLPAFNIADPPAVFAPTNLLAGMQARPRNVGTVSLSGWATGANTFLFSDNRGLGFSATAAGTTLISTTPTNGIPVSAATYYTASATLLTGATSRTVSVQIDWYDSSNAYLTSSTPVPGTDDPNTPTTLRLIARSHVSAAYGVVTVKVTTAEAANEAHILMDASLALA